MVDPTIIATFLLLLRPFDELVVVGELDEYVGVGVRALEPAVVEDEVGTAGELDAAEKRGAWVVVREEVVVLDVLTADVVALVVAGSDAALDAASSPPVCESVHNLGSCPSSTTILKLLLMNVGGVALEALRSDTSKWHTQAFPSLRGTRCEPLAETDSLYAGRQNEILMESLWEVRKAYDRHSGRRRWDVGSGVADMERGNSMSKMH